MVRQISPAWPPKAPDVLAAFGETGPRDLLGERQISERIRGVYESIKERKSEELSPRELEELDALAELLSQDPTIDDQIEIYQDGATLRISTIETDNRSFVSQ
jgi:hypothetical protein